MKKIFFALLAAVLVTVAPAYSATKSSGKQAAIQQGTKVRAKTAASGLYNQECYDAYYGCMDQFCIMDNEDGGSCACSDKNAGYESRLEKIKDTLIEADRLRTEEVERVQAGANADIIFNGTREYDKDTGDVVKTAKQQKEEKKQALLSLWDDDAFDDDDDFDEMMESIGDKKGDSLYKAADELCRSQMDEDMCKKDIPLLKQMYSRQIVSDCKGFENSVAKKEAEAKTEMASANAAVRSALKDSLEAANKYDRGECMVEYKKCMQGTDACGKDWENCVFTVAAENMQNNEAKSTARTKVETITTYGITPSTMEILESKRYICERVLDQCMAVRDNVWSDFLREAAPTIKLAESKIESKKRQSCLTDISNCIQKACKDDIVGKGKETMDACLARPDMARSFCKVEIDPCERMEPQIWDYVKDKLAAMRVDACTQEVKDCFTDENRCGENFEKCIGMDYAYIHDICPIDKLVVCKKANPKFAMSDLDSMLMGLYLNIDNAALDVCQNLVEEKMIEVCGSTTDCNKFAADDTMGTGSLQYQKDGAVHRVTGMISFGKVKVGSNVEDAGKIDLQDYVSFLTQSGAVPSQYASVADSILYELQNIQGTVDRVITMIEQDQKIQYCITGRNLEQITGKKETTSARFPNLLNQVKMQIANAALRQAQDNYNKKYNEYLSKAMDGASVDMANLMCNKLPASNGTAQGVSAAELDTQLVPSGAVVMEFGGVSNSSLAAGGSHTSATLGKTSMSTASGAAAGASSGGTGGTMANAAVAGLYVAMGGGFATTMASAFNPAVAITDAATKGVIALASDKYSVEFDGGTREMWSIFNRTNRICHYCTSTITKNCETKGSRGFLGLWDSRGVKCTYSDPVEKCEDIQM